MCTHECTLFQSIWHQKRASDTLELGLQAVVRPLNWALGTFLNIAAGRGYLCALLVRPVCDRDKHLRDQFKRKMDIWPSLQGFQLDPHQRDSCYGPEVADNSLMQRHVAQCLTSRSQEAEQRTHASVAFLLLLLGSCLPLLGNRLWKCPHRYN